MRHPLSLVLVLTCQQLHLKLYRIGDYTMNAINELSPADHTHCLFICSKINGRVAKEDIEFFDNEEDALEQMGMTPLYEPYMDGKWLEVWEVSREYEYDNYKGCGGYTLDLIRLVKEERQDPNAFERTLFNSLVEPFLIGNLHKINSRIVNKGQ